MIETATSPLLNASCIAPRSDIQHFCQQQQPHDTEHCIDDLLPVVMSRCSTWLNTDRIEVPVTFEQHPATACALPVVVNQLDLCALTQARAINTSTPINLIGQQFCIEHNLSKSQCSTLIQSMYSVSKEQRAAHHDRQSAASSVVSQDGSLPSMHPTGDVKRYDPPIYSENVGTFPITWNSEKVRAKWFTHRQDHQTLRHGRMQLYASHDVREYCMSIRLHGDITSNGALLNLGCLFQTKTMAMSQKHQNVLIENVPYGPHQIIIDGYDQDRQHISRSLLPMEVSAVHDNAATGPLSECSSKLHQSRFDSRVLSHSASPASSICLLTLVHRGEKALANALQSWKSSGLLDNVATRVAYVQNYSPTNNNDPRVSLLNQFHFHIVGKPIQAGIAHGISAGVIFCPNNTKHVLFVEEDFVAGQHIVEITKRAEKDLQSGVLDVARLRDVWKPGTPNCANIWKNKLIRIQSSINKKSWLDAAVVNIIGNHVKESAIKNIWRCGTDHKNTLCAFSSFASWTNNPFMVKRDWFLRNIAPIAAVDSTKTLEAAVSFSDDVWSKKCFIVGQVMAKGSFTHVDLDKKQYEQTVCPDIQQLYT